MPTALEKNNYERVQLEDGSFAKFEKPLTYKAPGKITYIEHTDTIYPIPAENTDKHWFKDYSQATIEKILDYDPYLAIKNCRDVLTDVSLTEVMWNEDRLRELDFIQLHNVYTLVSNANRIGLTNPELL